MGKRVEISGESDGDKWGKKSGQHKYAGQEVESGGNRNKANLYKFLSYKLFPPTRAFRHQLPEKIPRRI